MKHGVLQSGDIVAGRHGPDDPGSCAVPVSLVTTGTWACRC